MFQSLSLGKFFFKPFRTCTRNHQVAVVGAATDIGQTISLLLRGQPNVTKLVLHDTQLETQGITLDLSHIPTNAAVKGYMGEDALIKALENSEVVIGTGGMLPTPTISENECLNANINYIKYLARGLSRIQKKPFVGIVTKPINSLIPMAAEIMRNHGEYDPKKLFGITNIDLLRAQTLYAAQHDLDPRTVFIPVIGGHSNMTAIPLLSQKQPTSEVSKSQAHEFTAKFRNIDDTIIHAKGGYSPALSIAYSALLFTRNVLDALDGKQSAVNAFVENNDFGTEYFSGIVYLTKEGAAEMQMYSGLSEYECQLLEKSIEQIRKDVMKGKKILEYT